MIEMYGEDYDRQIRNAESLVAKGMLRRVRPGTYELTDLGRDMALRCISKLPWHLRLWSHGSHYFHRACRWLGLIE